MSDNEQDEIERIKNLMVEAVAKSANRPRAIHEAGHAVVALHLGLPLEGVNIEERDTPEGPKFGCAKVRSISESFSANELQEHSARVIDRVRKQVIMLLAAEAATRLILERPHDPLAQFDQSDIRHALRDFTELQAEMRELINATSEAISTRRADIEKLAGALVERMSLNADEVRQLIGD
jgi:hypothetical protein